MKSKKEPLLFLEAISFAARAHDRQTRRDGVTPYVSHVFRVAMTLRHVFKVENEKILAAAILPDVIEDCPVDYDELKSKFGPDIALWVRFVSKDKRMQEKPREKAYCEQLRNAPIPAKLIKLADMHDNLLDAGKTKKGKKRKIYRRAQEWIRIFEEQRSLRLRRPIRLVKRLLQRKVPH